LENQLNFSENKDGECGIKALTPTEKPTTIIGKQSDHKLLKVYENMKDISAIPRNTFFLVRNPVQERKPLLITDQCAFCKQKYFVCENLPKACQGNDYHRSFGYEMKY